MWMNGKLLICFLMTLKLKGYHDCPCGNVCYFNNLLLRENLSMYENSKLPTKMEGNVVDTLVQYRVEEMADGWYLEFIPTKSLSKECTKALVYSQQLGGSCYSPTAD